MNGPVRNRPSRSDTVRRSVFRSGLDWMMTVAPATGRPVGLSTVPPRDRPVSITPETAKARRSAAVTDCFSSTWSEWVVTSSSWTSGLAEAGRASDRHRPWSSVIAAATSLSGSGYRSRPPPGGAAPTCKSTRAPAIGRPRSSRTVPPIGTPRSRATTEFSGIGSSPAHRCSIGAKPGWTTTTWRKAVAPAGIAIVDALARRSRLSRRKPDPQRYGPRPTRRIEVNDPCRRRLPARACGRPWRLGRAFLRLERRLCLECRRRRPA